MAKNLLYLLLPFLVAFLILSAAQQEVVAADKEKQSTLDTDPHLAGWWKFDETSGRTAADSSKHEREGKLREDFSFDEDSADGRIGRALRFDSGEGFVEIADYKGVVGTKPRTVAAWIKTTRARGEIVSWGADDFGKMFTVAFIRGRVGIRPRGGYYYMNDPVHDGEWHHVAAVIKQADLPNLHDDAVLYKDGVVAEIHDIGLLDLWPIDTGSDMDVMIGDGFEGLIDDVRIYDRALGDEEMMALFKLQSDRPLAEPKK